MAQEEDCEVLRKAEAAWEYKYNNIALASQQNKEQLNPKDSEIRFNVLVRDRYGTQDRLVHSKEYSESIMTQQQIILAQATQQHASPMSRGAKTSIVTTIMKDSIINSTPKRRKYGAKTVQSGEGQNESDPAGKSKSGTVLYTESHGTKIRCAGDNNEYTSAKTSTMQQVIIPDDKDGNEWSWKQQRILDQETQKALPMSRNAQNGGFNNCASSVQHDSIIINMLPTRKKQTSWQNGSD